MSREQIENLREKLKKNLSASRYEHTLGVAYTAACLAMRYGEDAEKAEIAGLLHDCAKEYKDKELLKLGEEFHRSFTEEEKKTPQIWHAILGPYAASKKYGITDTGILEAIRWHTTGKADMTLLEKIVFTADYIEPNRNKANNLPEMRSLAFSDLTYCVYRISEDTLAYLKKKDIPADKMTKACYDWLKENEIHDKQ